MSSKNKISKQFADNYIDFLLYLKTFIKTNDKMKLFNNFYNKNLLLKKTNPSMIIKIWYTKVSLPYYNNILNDNIDFLLVDSNYNSIIDDVENTEYKDNELMDKIKTCIEDYKKLNDNQKEKLINNIKNLTLLSILYNKK